MYDIIVFERPNSNSNSDYTDIVVSVLDNNSENHLSTITCPKGKENEVINEIIKIFGGNYYDYN